MELLDIIRATYPWIEQMGLLDLVRGMITDDASPEHIVAEVRRSDQYKRLFPGMLDENGQRRFATEREYLERIQDYREVLREFNAFDPAQDTPMNYLGFMEQGIDPNELQRRYRIYRDLENGSQDLRDAYYVYAGMDVTVDDLYQAVVSPQFRNELQNEYDRQVAMNPFDYETFITRATERGLQRTAQSLRHMQANGLLTGEAVSQLLSVDPSFAREVMGALFTGGDPTGSTRTLSLDELMTSYEYAMLGSAATEQGLVMPSRERISEIRAAGIDRAKALRSYGAFAEQRTALQAMAQRHHTQSISQQLYEDAVFLSRGQATQTLKTAMDRERSLGQAGAEFQYGIDGRRITQLGRR